MLKKLIDKLKSSNWLNAVFKHGKWYLLASLSTKALGFILLPIYTQYLTPADYGILTSIEITNNLLPLFFSFTLVAAFDRFYHQNKGQAGYLPTLFSSIFFFVLVSGSIAVALAILSSYFWMPYFLGVPAYPYAIIGFAPALFMEITLLGFAFFRQSLKAKNVSLILIGSALINTAISLYLVIGLEMGVLGRLWGNLGATVFSFVAVIAYAYRKQLIKWSIQKELLKECLRYSVPLVPLAASHWAVGIYSIAFHISMILYFFGEAVVQVLAPITMRGLESKNLNIKKKLSDYTFYLWTFLMFGWLFVCFFSKYIIGYFLEESFFMTHAILPVLCLAIVFQIIHRLYGQLIKFHKKTKIFTIGAILSSCLNVGLNLLLIPPYGYMAAAYTTLFVSILYALFIIWQSIEVEPIYIPYSKYLFSMLLLFCLVIFVHIADIFLLGRILLFAINKVPKTTK